MLYNLGACLPGYPLYPPSPGSQCKHDLHVHMTCLCHMS